MEVSILKNVKNYTIEGVATVPVLWEIETKLNKKELVKAIYDGVPISKIDPNFEVFTFGGVGEAYHASIRSLTGQAQRFIRRLITRCDND